MVCHTFNLTKWMGRRTVSVWLTDCEWLLAWQDWQTGADMTSRWRYKKSTFVCVCMCTWPFEGMRSKCLKSTSITNTSSLALITTCIFSKDYLVLWHFMRRFFFLPLHRSYLLFNLFVGDLIFIAKAWVSKVFCVK